MSYLKYVTLIGTMHVSPRSREEVLETIERERPTAVAVELDPLRFRGITSGVKAGLKESLQFGRSGLVSYLLTKFEERLGEEFGMAPGGEMLAAIEAAGRLGVPLILIDEDIRMIMSKILAAPIRERLLLALEGLSFFFPGVGSAAAEELGDPVESYREMTLEFRNRYPYLYRVLVKERNAVMARNLISAVDEFRMRGIKRPRIVAVVGLGHREGIAHLLDSPQLLGNIYNLGFVI
ncbi:TraB domain-containing protein [Thermococcus sp. Bubb.Bath]|uniref:TraB/GumN family protein n=1 Tax=Thermococcus sp. Bubb.Bath TaxID=1638242 RepID=UPI001438D043|nr:conjugal transfer protein TraB [Thermococcus sp. Bubb.Bath]